MSPRLTDLAARAFDAVDRLRGGWLTCKALLDGLARPEFRALLAEVFGGTILQQPSSELREDVTWLFEHLDVREMGEVCRPDFISGFPRLLQKVRPFPPESPRISQQTKARLAALQRGSWHTAAEVAFHKPQSALRRLARRTEAAQREGGHVAAAMLLAQGGKGMAELFVDFQWSSLPDEELAAALGRVVGLAAIVEGAGSDLGLVAPLLLRAKAGVAETALMRCGSWPSRDFVLAVCAALPPAVPATGDVVLGTPEAQRRHELAVAVADRVPDLPLVDLARALQAFACPDECQGHLSGRLVAAAADGIVAALRQQCGLVPQDCGGQDIVSLLWGLAQHRVHRGAFPDDFESSRAARALSAALVARPGALAALTDHMFARMCWAVGRLADFRSPLLQDAAKEAVERAAPARFVKLRPSQLAHVVWALASLGAPPVAAEFLARAAEAADLEALGSWEAAHLAGGLGIWVTGRPEKLTRLWTALRWRSNDFCSEEVVIVVRAVVRLGARDDLLMQCLAQRAASIGPFDTEGARDLLRCFEQYYTGKPSEVSRQLVADCTTALARHGNVAEIRSVRLGPPPWLDHRMDGLLEARRAAAGVLIGAVV